MTDSWIERVKQADAEAEAAWKIGCDPDIDATPSEAVVGVLIAIAAELRAQRIARRPGAGQ